MAAVTSAPVLEAAPEIRNPYLEGNYAPVEVETTAVDLPVIGTLPEALAGRLVRIGPNPLGRRDPATYHWFTGLGMMHGLRLRDGKAEWYRNRFVGCDAVAEALGRPKLEGPRHGFFDVVNTHVQRIGGRDYALVEAGAKPVEFDGELNSLRRSDFGGTLPGGFTAHPKRDPATGELFAIAYEPGKPTLSYVRVSPEGLAEVRAEVPAPHLPMVHDTAFTQSFVVVLDFPVVFSVEALQMGLPYVWDDARPCRVGLLPRSGDLEGLSWFETPTGFVFHVMNAFERPGEVVLDVVRHPKVFDRVRTGPAEGPPTLVRWVLNLATGKVSETGLAEGGVEFPRLNESRSGRSYRYGYTTSNFNRQDRSAPILKHDLEQGRSFAFDLGPGRFAMEPVFVSREGARGEDDGWLLAFVHDAGRNAAEVVVLNADDPQGPPAARVQLPVRVPYGFHGDWFADPA